LNNLKTENSNRVKTAFNLNNFQSLMKYIPFFCR